MYKCADCGHIFEEGEQAIWYEDRGEFWGVPCRERMTGCPVCHGAYEEFNDEESEED
jgi:predicted  nucleic acid-binding Zn-ribbon protein